MAIETFALIKNTELPLLEDEVKQLSELQQGILIRGALQCLESRLPYQSEPQDSYTIKKYLRLALAPEKNEVFGVLFLNNKHRVIAFEKLFQGTINSCSIYPRVVLQRALAHNAAAVIFAHNHPSGDISPSQDDVAMTEHLKKALALVDIRVLDHIIVSLVETYSLSEHGLVG